MAFTKEEFKKVWESSEDGGGITFDDIADCAVSWGISNRPKTCPIHLIRYKVLKAANVNDCEEFKPDLEDDQ